MIQTEPIRSATFTGRMLTLLSAPTTATMYFPCISVTARWGISSAPFFDSHDRPHQCRTGRDAACCRDWGRACHLDRSGRRIDLPVGQGDFPFVGIDASVGQDQFQRDCPLLFPVCLSRRTFRYSCSLTVMYALIGSTVETVVSSPDLSRPDQVADLGLGDPGHAVDEGGILVKPRSSWAFSSCACAAFTAPGSTVPHRWHHPGPSGSPHSAPPGA